MPPVAGLWMWPKEFLQGIRGDLPPRIMPKRQWPDSECAGSAATHAPVTEGAGVGLPSQRHRRHAAKARKRCRHKLLLWNEFVERILAEAHLILKGTLPKQESLFEQSAGNSHGCHR